MCIRDRCKPHEAKSVTEIFEHDGCADQHGTRRLKPCQQRIDHERNVEDAEMCIRDSMRDMAIVTSGIPAVGTVHPGCIIRSHDCLLYTSVYQYTLSVYLDKIG